MKRLSLLLALVAAVPVVSAQAADKFEIDGMHSSLFFEVKHMNIAPFYGRFNDLSGTIVLDREDVSKSSVMFEIKAESVDTNSEGRDKHLRSPDFFNAKQFPVITFKSTQVKANGKDAYDVTGDLTMHGVTKPVTVKVTKVGEGDSGRGYKAGFAANFMLKRSDYGMKGMLGGIGDDITIRMGIEANRVE